MKEIRSLEYYGQDVLNDLQGIIGVGSEGCAKFFCYAVNKFLLNPQLIKFRIAIITPRVSQHYFNEVVELIKKLYEKVNVVYIVVNDWGLLHFLKELNLNKIILGRILVRGMVYAPWSSLYSPKNQVTNNDMVNVFHKSKLELFNTLGITGVELCGFNLIEEAIDFLHQNSFEVHVHEDTVIATVGRTCPQARFMEVETASCDYLCKEDINIELDEIWLGPANFVLCDKKNSPVPDYICRDCIVYYINEKTVTLNADVIVIDYKIRKEYI